MIPKRIKMSGVLSYRDEQELSFEGHSLWMLSGANGSGKSTVFDAITFALFGYHRAGGTNISSMINSDSKSMSIEFEFTVDDRPYLIRRGLTLTAKGDTKSTTGAFELNPQTGRWDGVRDTNRSEQFKNWARKTIGLDYETFTASVLLLQGHAEKLLDTKPTGRGLILGNIVDLERFKKLHTRADDQRKSWRDRLEALKAQADAIPDVSDIEWIESENRIDASEQARTDANKAVERWQQIEVQAARHSDTLARLGTLNARWERHQATIADATAIEKAYRRFSELKQVIPQVLIIQEKQSAILESTRRTSEFTVLKARVHEDKLAHENLIETQRKKRDELRKTQGINEQRLQDANKSMQELATHLGTLRTFEEQTIRLQRTEEQLKSFKLDPAKALADAQQAHDAAVEASMSFPIVQRFAQAREQIGQAKKRAEKLEADSQTTKANGEKARQKADKAREKLAKATAARQKAEETATEARTILAQAQAAFDDLKKVKGAKTCKLCGSPLTAAHLADETSRRETELAKATKASEAASQEKEEAIAEETNAKAALEKADQALAELREGFRDTKKDLDQAIQTVERLKTECHQAFQDLPASMREGIEPGATWETISWPTKDDVTRLQSQSGGLDIARTRLRDAQEKKNTFDKLNTEKASIQATLEQVRRALPTGEPAKLRDKETELRSEQEALQTQVMASKRQVRDAEVEIERLNRELATTMQQLSTLDASLAGEEASQREYHDAVERATRLLPESWRGPAVKAGLAEQSQWKSELDTLTTKGAESRYEELAMARATVSSLREDINTVSAELADFPAEARYPIEEVKAKQNAAKRLAEQTADDVQKAREEKAILERHRSERKKVNAEILETERESKLATVLAQLLGKDRLQRYLVRTAERQIVDIANSVLDRLSAGQLFLRLVVPAEGTTNEKALELEAYNRNTGSQAINVDFLSGSQRFRVAVALALGIGQYASRQHRPIESVIIDEGFGCLDRTGRQVMIQELQNLQGQLKCVILVSHQEEFADAFPNGYRFELKDGATQVSRFRR